MQPYTQNVSNLKKTTKTISCTTKMQTQNGAKQCFPVCSAHNHLCSGSVFHKALTNYKLWQKSFHCQLHFRKKSVDSSWKGKS